MDFNAFVALLLTPVGLGLLGLCVGSFLNVVVHRVPLIMERQWWVDIGQQLADADSWKKVFGSELPATANPLAAHIDTAAQGLAPLSLMHPASRCPACGTAIRWYHNLPVLGWLMLGGKCAACKAPISLRYPLVEALTGALFLGLGWRLGAAPRWPGVRLVRYCWLWP
jgi:leader peptidase (prepilin peptidase) / N-methyltransferase